MERALADLEIVASAFPDETSVDSSSNNNNRPTFPLHVTLHLSETAHVVLVLVNGYPVETNVQIASYRSSSKKDEKTRIERVVTAIRATAADCLQDGVEGGLACCAVALEAWNDNEYTYANEQQESEEETILVRGASTTAADDDDTAYRTTKDATTTKKQFIWTSGEPLLDRKSTFQAHVCRIESEQDVPIALQQLLNSHTKFHRAAHNMFAWRLIEVINSSDNDESRNKMMTTILKHDNDDDGEDAAGSRLAQLLEFRQENGVLVVVSRWFGGIHLGPKRFAHITNVARQVLVDWHAAVTHTAHKPNQHTMTHAR